MFNYFLKTMVFLNDRGIGKYVVREDWVQKKDWPFNVDKWNKKYATYSFYPIMDVQYSVYGAL